MPMKKKRPPKSRERGKLQEIAKRLGIGRFSLSRLGRERHSSAGDAVKLVLARDRAHRELLDAISCHTPRRASSLPLERAHGREARGRSL